MVMMRKISTLRKKKKGSDIFTPKYSFTNTFFKSWCGNNIFSVEISLPNKKDAGDDDERNKELKFEKKKKKKTHLIVQKWHCTLTLEKVLGVMGCIQPPLTLWGPPPCERRLYTTRYIKSFLILTFAHMVKKNT